MDDYRPDDEAVAAIRRNLVIYEEQRAIENRHRSIFLPISLAPAVLVTLFGIAMLLTADEAPFGAKDKFQFAFWVILAAMLLGGGGIWLAEQPAKRLQQRLRDQMLPALFGFVGDIEYAHGQTPLTFDHIPKGLLPAHAHTEFGDVVRGMHRFMRFELFEVELKSGGKSKTTVFDGVIVGFQVPSTFPGVLVVTPRIGTVGMFFRDMFGTAYTTVEVGHPPLDEAFEFRTDNSLEGKRLIVGPLRHALGPLRDAWRDAPPRLALSYSTGFLMMSTGRDFFELPDIGSPADYEQHIAPMVKELLHLLETAQAVRRAMAGQEGVDEGGLLD